MILQACLLFTTLVVRFVCDPLPNVWPVAAQANPSHVVTVDLPLKWVPFTATIVYRDAQGHSRYGKFYRDSNGSTTTVNVGEDGAPVITINNLETGRSYALLGRNGWVTYPPDQTLATEPRPRLSAVGSRMERLNITVAGGAVYEFRQSKGVIRWAVALNGFPVYIDETHGSSTEFVDISVGEPPSDLFAPPAGTVARARERQIR
jgi:hypothetical protein